MFRISVLASGSKGNCTVVATSRTRLILDAGLSCREIVKRMRLRGEGPENMDAILVTHEHSDHVQGLSVLARRWNLPVYTTQGTHAAWKQCMAPRKRTSFQSWLEERRRLAGEAEAAANGTGSADGCVEQESYPLPDAQVSIEVETSTPDTEALFPPDPSRDDPAFLPRVEYFRAGIRFQIGDISILPFTIPHDAADPVGFVLEAEGLRAVIATDLGYLPPNVRMHLQCADMLMIESNHDVEMLRDGPYPWVVKQRVLSRVGHLSNDALGDYLRDEYDGSARFVVLAHLSESNNLPELARASAERALENRMNLLHNRILLASQNQPLESIQL